MTERFGVHLVAVCRQHDQPRNIGVADVARGDVAQQFKFHNATMNRRRYQNSSHALGLAARDSDRR
jgi:hypothetical protein